MPRALFNILSSHGVWLIFRESPYDWIRLEAYVGGAWQPVEVGLLEIDSNTMIRFFMPGLHYVARFIFVADQECISCSVSQDVWASALWAQQSPMLRAAAPQGAPEVISTAMFNRQAANFDTTRSPVLAAIAHEPEKAIAVDRVVQSLDNTTDAVKSLDKTTASAPEVSEIGPFAIIQSNLEWLARYLKAHTWAALISLLIVGLILLYLDQRNLHKGEQRHEPPSSIVR